MDIDQAINRELERQVAGGPRERKVPVAISFAPSILAQIDARRDRRGQSRSGVVNQAVTEALERWAREEKEAGR